MTHDLLLTHGYFLEEDEKERAAAHGGEKRVRGRTTGRRAGAAGPRGLWQREAGGGARGRARVGHRPGAQPRQARRDGRRDPRDRRADHRVRRLRQRARAGRNDEARPGVPRPGRRRDLRPRGRAEPARDVADEDAGGPVLRRVQGREGGGVPLQRGDVLLGLPVQDRDYVVVGATPEDLEARGFHAVGKDFPVFLHPRTQAEYALARTERKTAAGYKGFSVYYAPDVTLEEARRIQAEVGGETSGLTAEQFRKGLEVELEHGTAFPDANVTNNHPLLTGKIVLAHLKESMDYYKRLEVAEIEGDILKAMVRKDMDKVQRLHKELVKARLELSESEWKELGGE
mgnify:CR=1 FL=1